MSTQIRTWIHDRSSGYDGFRCADCGVWIYANEAKRCNCDRKDSYNEPKYNKGMTKHELLSKLFDTGATNNKVRIGVVVNGSYVEVDIEDVEVDNDVIVIHGAATEPQ